VFYSCCIGFTDEPVCSAGGFREVLFPPQDAGAARYRKMKKKLISLLFCALLITPVILPVAGELSGLQNGASPFDGYTLFAPMRATTTYLINNGGEVVHTWASDYRPRMSAFLLENGNLVRTAQLGGNPTFDAGGAGGRVEEIDWDGTIVWDFEYSSSLHLLHHDIEPLPNGNVLMIAWEWKSAAEAIAAGRNPGLVTDELWPDHIIEVEPTGASGGNIVWEWHVWDHLIQDYDSTKENYGIVADHPGLIDINFSERVDWNHINSVDYNQGFDQIILSVHAFSEIWVIDHSTTTEEAAGHAGGNSGKGGDILYRWGNPQAYRAGGEADRKFFRQHDAGWIESGLPGEGNILVFNNGPGRPGGDYSSVDEFVPPVDSNGTYYLAPDSAYGPENQIWTYTAENPGDFFALNLGGAQRLPDGNTLICDGPHGIFFEVTPEGDIVWEYVNLFPNPNGNNTFRVLRYAPDYPGLEDLFPNQGPEKPSTPIGPASGKTGVEYQYTTSTTDPEGDQIYYLFDWGDDTDSSWLGPYNSGDTAEASHIWTDQGNYEIKVIAKDENGVLSEWSDSLLVSIGVLCGDANGSGAVEPADVVYLLNYLFIAGSPPPVPVAAGDVNCDGVVNGADVVYILNWLFRNGPNPCDPDNDGIPDC
jgi:hypothetical protein